MSNDFVGDGLIDRTLGTGDHKTVGRLWILSGLLVALGGLVLRLIASVEYLDNGAASLLLEDADELVQVWSAGRTLLVFGGLVPVLVGIGTFIVPLQVGSNTIAFPRGAAAAFWMWLLSTGMLCASYLANGGPGGGTRDFVVLWAVALGGVLAAIVWSLVCIAATVLGARAPGMALEMVPTTAWSYFVFALLGILALPIQIGQLIIAFIDVRGGYLPVSDTTPLAGVMDSILLAPASYWLIIPALGIALDTIAVHTDRPLRFHRSILAVLGLLAITAFAAGVTSFGSRGRVVDFNNAFLVVALAASILPILVSLALGAESLKAGERSGRVPLLAGLAGGFLALGGATVALLATVEPIVGFFAKLADQTPDVPDRLTLNGTTFNAGISVFIITAGLLGCLAGIQHWGHKIWGHQISTGFGTLSLLSLLGGGSAWAIGEILGGLDDQPALPAVTVTDGSLASIGNILTVAGIAGVAAGVGLLLLNVVLSGLLGSGSVAEPWKGQTLEWLADSPPAYSNFVTQPTVASIYPLLDIEAADAAENLTVEGEPETAKKEVTA